MRRTITNFLLVLTLVAAIPLSASAAAVFKDINRHWAEESIAALAEKGYIKGYPDGTFRPDNTVSRAEFLAILTACLGIKPDGATTVYFSDTRNHWALAQINEMVKRGVLVPAEYPGGLNPNGPILRSETAAMLVRALGKEPSAGEPAFSDRTSLNKSMYRGYIKAASELGLVSGYPDGEFKPFEKVTRAQACIMFNKFLAKLGISSSPGTSYPSTSDSISALVLDGKRYDLSTTPLLIKQDLSEIPVSYLKAISGFLYVNGTIRFPLNSSSGNPDLVIGTNRYCISSMSVSGSNLVATTRCRKLYKMAFGGHTYNADYLRLYTGNLKSKLYLSDAELVDESTLRISGTSYDLSADKVSLALEGKFYRITGINFGDRETTLKLVETDPVLIENPEISDILAIFAGPETLDLDSISRIDFFIDGEKYNLSSVIIDSSGNFEADDNIYSPSQIIMLVDGNYYQLDEVKMRGGKLIIYCTETNNSNWVVINDKYHNADDVKILKDGESYDLDDVLVVSRNLLRIKGRQYEVGGSDSVFRCRFDGKFYKIKSIDYDTKLEMVTMKVIEDTGYQGANQPDHFNFYFQGSIYHSGTDDVSIYAGGSWRDFDRINIIDPARFSYGDSGYSLINTKVRIDNEEFIIDDTVWRASSNTLDIYLEEG
ncbi:MAG TPA: S-layer homology domain-containing protein [Syntrophomonadaceae bacterium]|nr:S-layer homology domain-containing protein [Syntrophomonadaceae bacterium]